jgi:hypothetical protein
MKINKILWFTIVPLALLLASCGGDEPAGEDPNKGGNEEEEVSLTAPSQLKVLTFTHNSVIVSWQGDTNALAYDVHVSGKDTLAVESISCGVDDLQPDTPYTWQVRARRGQVKTAWVTGPGFRTEVYNNVVSPWAGEWYSQGWSGSVDILGMNVPYSQFGDQMPDDFDLEALVQSMEVTIEEADEEGCIDMTLPAFPAQLPVQGGKVTLPLNNEKATIQETLPGTPIPVITEPVPIADIPFISGLPDIPGGDNISITSFSVTLSKLTIVFGPCAADTIPVVMTIEGTVALETSDGLVNAILAFAGNSLKITIKSTLYRKEE